ncbi:HNH endonuclease [Paenibacillus sp. RU4T]|nr:HNH endonuclease [Paenibacillus sp. RU4X]SIQ53253.1 HNH endonuclease [Paenibacillus sp. RU4T]
MPMETGTAQGRCELCGRSGVGLTEHHLTPREQGGTFKGTALLCPPCHRQIHALYTNADLVQRELTTIEALRADEAIAVFIRYIRKQPPSSMPKLRKSARVRNKH